MLKCLFYPEVVKIAKLTNATSECRGSVGEDTDSGDLYNFEAIIRLNFVIVITPPYLLIYLLLAKTEGYLVQCHR